MCVLSGHGSKYIYNATILKHLKRILLPMYFYITRIIYYYIYLRKQIANKNFILAFLHLLISNFFFIIKSYLFFFFPSFIFLSFNISLSYSFFISIFLILNFLKRIYINEVTIYCGTIITQQIPMLFQLVLVCPNKRN